MIPPGWGVAAPGLAPGFLPSRQEVADVEEEAGAVGLGDLPGVADLWPAVGERQVGPLERLQDQLRAVELVAAAERPPAGQPAADDAEGDDALTKSCAGRAARRHASVVVFLSDLVCREPED